eukprot:6755060-Pyramimonas_sp.AAC.1
MFARVEAHIRATFAAFKEEKGGAANVDITYEQAVAMATRFPDDQLVTDTDAFKWHQAMQVESGVGAPVNMLSMRSYAQDPYTHFTAPDGSDDADQ